MSPARRPTVFLALGGCALAAWLGLASEGRAERSTRPPRDTSEPASAAEPSDRKTADKLDQVLQNQQLILQRLDEVMKELQIVKIRATQN